MIKPDEIEFMREVLFHDGRIPSVNWDRLTKRQYAILDKWSERKGYWDYGVTLRSGWLTEKGIAALKAAVGEADGKVF